MGRGPGTAGVFCFCSILSVITSTVPPEVRVTVDSNVIGEIVPLGKIACIPSVPLVDTEEIGVDTGEVDFKVLE
jgi:hypothetical protein